MLQSWATSVLTDFHVEEYSSKIAKVRFAIASKVPDTKIKYWDVSNAKDKSVMAWIEDDGNEGYILTIAGKNKIIANVSSANMFRGFYKLTFIENIQILDTSKVVSMSSMFEQCVELKRVDVCNFDTSKVVDMRNMFLNCNSLESLGNGQFNIGNSERNEVDVQNMFNVCNKLTATINIKKVGLGYLGMFSKAATITPAKITLNYTANMENKVNEIVENYKNRDSNIVKGNQI